ncbi:MAG: sulfatase-like hydrolase/transferase, partial [Actinomycetes bacterium]|nr:sulfatase-like hydrolase/transferase [Actinomycetes bacterium]
IVFIQGDNGASAEGSPQGLLTEMTFFNNIKEPFSEVLKRMDELGGPMTFNHYPIGWAHAMDTPFQWTKQVASHFGGTRNGLVVSWPAWIADRGARRFQFHHVIDVLPTLLEVLEIPEPTMVDGVAQRPIEGVSMAYSFDRANAGSESARTIQYFEMLGNRGLYQDGWMASCRHGRLPWETSGTADFAQDRWELYDIESDFSQSEDLAERFPERLRAMQDRFLVEAAKYGVFPLDDRFSERVAAAPPGHFSGRTEVTLYPGMPRLPEGSGPRLANVDHTFTVHAELPAGGAEGVLVCMGGDQAGWSLFVEGGRLRYHYNWFNFERYDVIAEEALPAGRVRIRLEFRCERPGERGGPAW